jgi:two-component system chemotaxis response regulator CheB
MTKPKKKIRVFCIDDSSMVRQLLTEIFSSQPDFEVVGTAPDAFVAREKIKQTNPDVLTLDVEMPRMDGLTFLRNLMRLRPMPVVMVSSLTEKGAEVTLDALSVGAVDFVAKPKIDVAGTLRDYSDELCAKVRMAAAATVRTYTGSVTSAASAVVTPRYGADAILAKASPLTHMRTTDRLIAIGASTGGTEAIKEVLMGLPPDMPGIVITQHIPKAFSGPFAKRMDSICALTVFEAENGQQILPGHVYIAPGDQHLLVVRDGARYVCRLDDGVLVNRHKPSVDVLFRSVAQAAGRNAIGAILTGMGKDGAVGLKEMLEAGAATIAQDEMTSVVWGMPGEAVAIGAAQHVLPLERVAPKLGALAEQLDITKTGTRG